MTYIIIFLWGYFLGAFPSGYIAGKIKGIDLTKIGSGSTGTTNVLRNLGKKWAFVVLLCDFLKGALCFVSIFFLSKFFNFIVIENIEIAKILCCLGVIIGHVKSIWIGFKGGKAVATGVGTFFALDPIVGLAIASIWIFIAVVFRISSLAGLSAAFCSPFLMYFISHEISFSIYCLVAAIYIFYKHKENIKRLLAGTEPKFGQKN